jgi:predicted transcriptional regulator
VESTGNSRSTVDRAIADLIELSFVERTNGKFETTTTGRLFLGVVEEMSETLRTIRDASDVFERVDDDAPIDSQFLTGATVRVADSSAPLSAVDGALDKLSRANRVRGFAVADNDPRWTRTLYERATEDSLTVEVGLTESMANYVVEQYSHWVEDYVGTETFELRVCPSVPFGLAVVETDAETTVYLLVHDENGTFAALVENDRPAAIAWAMSLFEDRFESGRPLEERIG